MQSVVRPRPAARPAVLWFGLPRWLIVAWLALRVGLSAWMI